MSDHKSTKKGPIYGEFNFAKGGAVYVKGYVRGGKVEKMSHGGTVHQGPMSDKDMRTPVGSNVKKILGTMKYAGGGLTNLTHRADSLDNPRPSGITPTKVNVKARMSPRYDKGGMVHLDAKQDKALIKKAIRQHDKNLHGGAKDPIKLKHGGKAK